MLVYGDAVRRETAAATLAAIEAMLALAARQEPGWRRHAELVAALVAAGELVQGLADADFHAAGDVDRASSTVAASMALLMAIAGRCARSWRGDCDEGDGDDLPQAALAALAAVQACAAQRPAEPLVLKQPEGYAFYALYPESYLEAALRVGGGGRWQVIGIRSIGTSLAAMVATGLGGPAPLTLRPLGHPFARRVSADPSLVDRAADRYAIVDEGPGLSGSSIAAVAEWLAEAGVGPERLHVFASHGGGPGPQASASVREWWQALRVHVASFDETVLNAGRPAQRLSTWLADVVGPLHGPLREISGGAWRALTHKGRDRPPVHAWQERRKFLAETPSGHWLVKFSGLGRRGACQLQRARALAAAGMVAAPAGLCHGFIVERWRDDLAPLAPWLPVGTEVRERLLERVGEYLAFRAGAFAAADGSGATAAQLHAMGRHNTAEALGAEAAATWDAWQPALDDLGARMQRVETDNRLHAWEWLVGSDAVLKADALDHHAGHDLVGCQDIAWDVVGAAVELGLSQAEEERLAVRVAERSGRAACPDLRAFLRPCYLAFQLGHWTEARSAATVDEAARIGRLVEGYARALKKDLERRAGIGPAGPCAREILRA